MTPGQNSVPPGDDNPAGPVVLLVLPALAAEDETARDVVDIATAVKRAGAAAIVASAGGPLLRELTRAGVEHVVLPLDRHSMWTARANARRLAELIQSAAVDLVDVRGVWPARSVRRAAELSDVALVTTVDTLPPSDNPMLRRFHGAEVCGDRVIVGSAFLASQLRDRFGLEPARLRLVPPGIEPGHFAAEAVRPERIAALARAWQLPDGEPAVLVPTPLSSARGAAALGAEDVAAALAHLHPRRVHCVILASEPGDETVQRTLANRIARLNLAGTVRIVDRCPDRPAAYRLCDAVVVPAPVQAGMALRWASRAVLEAQASGRPVIAEDAGGGGELVRPGETGWLVPPGNVEVMAATLDLVLSLDEADRMAVADRAASAAAAFTRSARVAATLAVYHDLLSAAPSGLAAGPDPAPLPIEPLTVDDGAATA